MEILSDAKVYATKSQPSLIIFQENSATKDQPQQLSTLPFLD